MCWQSKLRLLFIWCLLFQLQCCQDKKTIFLWFLIFFWLKLVPSNLFTFLLSKRGMVKCAFCWFLKIIQKSFPTKRYKQLVTVLITFRCWELDNSKRPVVDEMKRVLAVLASVSYAKISSLVNPKILQNVHRPIFKQTAFELVFLLIYHYRLVIWDDKTLVGTKIFLYVKKILSHFNLC